MAFMVEDQVLDADGMLEKQVYFISSVAHSAAVLQSPSPIIKCKPVLIIENSLTRQ